MKQAITAIFRFVLKISFQLAERQAKKENILVLSGHSAKYLTGNVLYLFLYLQKTNPAFRYFFFTKNRKEYRRLKRQYPEKILYAYHWNTFFILAKAKVLTVVTCIDDFFPYPLCKKKKIINLWHGTPIKNIGFLVPEVEEKPLVRFSEALQLFCVSSEFEGKIMQKAFRLPTQKIFVSGLPKNDYIGYDYSSFLKQHPFLAKKIE
jgi:CDP-glycerol glycerophosphotransferase